ncbi:MAG: site-specific integrase [Nitrospinae bacterium]|nr:site-specific integrase [Nitrospinota bacterium]
MPHLYNNSKRGSQVKYRVFFPDGTHRDKIKFRKKETEAQQLFADVTRLESLSRQRAIKKDEIKFCLNMGYLTKEEALQLSGTPDVNSFATWHELNLKYEQWSREHCRPYTHTCNLNRLYKIIDYFKDISPANLTKENIESYISFRKNNGLHPDTISKDLIIIRHLLDNISPDTNPARHIPLLKGDGEKIRRALSRGEIKAFMESLERYKHLLYGNIKPIVLIYLYAGLRPSEILRLKPSDIDIENNKIHVQGQTKTRKKRSIDIHPELSPLLKKIKKKREKKEYLFKEDRKTHSHSLSRTIKEIMREAGLPEDVPPYALRHSFVSYLLKSTRDLTYVMKMAGHTNIKTTQGYLSVIEDKESPMNQLKFSG